MNRYERVLQILDAAVGGPAVSVGFPHGAFWRGLNREAFVARKVAGVQLITVGNGGGSMLVKALKGESPFGADLPNPPLDATFSRMPAGLDPVPAGEIAFIQQWIDEGCLEDETATAIPLTWRKTNAPVASSRTDDIWFVDRLTGWAVNSDGNILKTTDGGETWAIQLTAPGVYFRCVGFADGNTGWVGTLTRNRRLFRTTDGGANWSRVTNLPANAPVAICGISVVSPQIVYASGTNRPEDFPRVLKTTDGGTTWTAIDMSAHASILIDTFFLDALHGWVVGGKSDQATPTTRSRVKPVVLETTDGGASWTNRLAGMEAGFPLGEWGWKIQFVNQPTGFVSLENLDAGAILKTGDGGRTWTRIAINDPQSNHNLEGVGFVDERQGWVGGWGSRDFQAGFSSATTDGGTTWQDANGIGRFLNRFRFFGSPVDLGYASGDTVYKYSSAPLPAPHVALTTAKDALRALLPDTFIRAAALPVRIRMNVPAGTRRLSLQAWTRFGDEAGTVLDEIRPVAGERIFVWDGSNAAGNLIEPGDYILRILADDMTASSILILGGQKTQEDSPIPLPSP